METVTAGLADQEGDVIRKAKVIIGKKEDTTTAESSQQPQDPSQTIEEENVDEVE